LGEGGRQFRRSGVGGDRRRSWFKWSCAGSGTITTATSRLLLLAIEEILYCLVEKLLVQLGVFNGCSLQFISNRIMVLVGGDKSG
ncbi:hypothetical protein HAX54_006105, partial [Datura stramonium]|nr:hypothetical protein [Datura stramonium]